MKVRKSLLVLFVVTLLTIGSLHGYNYYDVNRVKVQRGDCLVKGPGDTGEAIKQNAELFLYVDNVLTVEKKTEKQIRFYIINVKSGLGFVGLMDNSKFNANAKKVNLRFVNCDTMDPIKDF